MRCAAVSAIRWPVMTAAGAIAGILAAAELSTAAANTPINPKLRALPMSAVSYVPVTFAEIPGWEADDHLAAFDAFMRSCRRIVPQSPSSRRVLPADLLADICGVAATLSQATVSRSAAKAFFEAHFTPHRVAHADAAGMVTGYYEPVVKGSRKRGRGFTAPILRRPADLVNVVQETERGAKADGLTHVRRASDGQLVPYPTRKEIEEGALAGMGLELLYLSDPVDVFFMQVQGSGRVELDDGTTVRVTYDGKNGHPYTSVGRHLIETGQFTTEQVSLQSLERWLRSEPERGRAAMQVNESYVFFRELAEAEAQGPLGAMSIPLSEGRSLAVDTTYHALGLPVWVSSPKLTHVTPPGGFGRLMVAHDVGSAIRGPERGDIYFGSGDAAGRLAGITKHAANFIVLLPNAAADDLEASTGGATPGSRTAGQ